MSASALSQLERPCGAMEGAAGPRWAVVLAGSEGSRARGFADTWLQEITLNQDGACMATHSMLQHALNRAASIVPPRKVVAVIAPGHREHLTNGATPAIPGLLVEQPTYLGTAPGILLSTAYIIDRDPEATIVILPSDHFVHPEELFLKHMTRASQLAEQCPGKLVLLGADPDRPEGDYGWVATKEWFQWPHDGQSDREPLRAVHFREKPALENTRTLLRRNTLWNTMVIAVKAKTLWALARACLPAMTARFDAFRQILCAVHCGEIAPEFEGEALADLFKKLQPADFSEDVLERATAQILVMPMEGVTWCDWGHSLEIGESLADVGVHPVFTRAAIERALEAAGEFARRQAHCHGPQRSNAVRQRCQENGRFGVDIRGVSMHAEVDKLDDILPLIEKHDGWVDVIDRADNTRVFQGAAEELRATLGRAVPDPTLEETRA